MKNIFLITGFLGAGKTTFVNGFLDKYMGRVAVIVNEFGNEGIDGELLHRSDSTQIYEINSGSIFCSCKLMDFANALIQIAKYNVEVVLVEASGLSDPSNLEDIITRVNEKSDNAYDFMGSICLVDAKNFTKLAMVLPTLESQVKACNYILINKCDLVNQSSLSRLEDEILKLNSNAQIIKTTYGKFPDLPMTIKELKPSNPSNNTPTTRPNTNIVHPRPLRKTEVKMFAKQLTKKAYRAKGFITIDGQKHYLDIVDDQTTIIKTDLDSEDKIVLLSLKK